MSALLFPLNGALLLIHLAVWVLVIAGLIDVARRPDGAFVAAGKQSKVFWLVVLAVGFFIWLVGIIGGIVYFVDVRPAVGGGGGGRGGGRGGGSSSDGPYGRYNG
jgi:hypothetical protein